MRGSTALGEKLEPKAYAAVFNRFYRAATEVLIRQDAIIDKLMGDEVMALFIPGICGPEYRRRAAQAALALLQAVGYGQSAGPWMPIGVAVNSGLAYVGNVGSKGVVDFTALGDAVNTAARLASNARAGEILLSEPVYAGVAEQLPNLELRHLTLRGKEAPVAVRVLAPGRQRPTSAKRK
jgi:adenylate cyclase